MKEKISFVKRYFTVFLLFLLILLSVLVPLLSPYPYDLQNIEDQNMPASVLHWFGTDRFGRDLFTRAFYGLRISLEVGGASALISLAAGTAAGSVAGYCGKAADTVILEVMNVISAIPSMLYVILIMLVLEAGTGSVIAGICVSGWVDFGRLVRSETKRIRHTEYCLAAEMMGVKKRRIIWKYILRNQRKLLLVQTMLFIPKAIFTEAFLSFIGIGIAAPRASLGTLIQDARSQITLYPWQTLFPVFLLIAVILCFQSIGYSFESRENYCIKKERKNTQEAGCV